MRKIRLERPGLPRYSMNTAEDRNCETVSSRQCYFKTCQKHGACQVRRRNAPQIVALEIICLKLLNYEKSKCNFVEVQKDKIGALQW